MPNKALTNCGKLEVRESPIEGYGVFAVSDIKAGEVLEEVPFVLFPRHTNISKGLYDFLSNNKFVSERERSLDNLRLNLKFKDPEKYYFKWHPTHQTEGECMFTVLPLGYGPIYNTSNTANNADWRIMETTFIFRAEKDIAKDEEIRTFYGYFIGEDGSTFNCDLVYNMAIDRIDGVNRLKNFRFGTLVSFDVGKANPAYLKINQLVNQSLHGVVIKQIVGLQVDGKEITGFTVPHDIPLSQLYIKLAEFKQHFTPVTAFVLEYEQKADGKISQETILVKK
jgi:hypothetical protein